MDERQKLCELIKQWNENRLDLFSLSQPDENLEFHGVMRFYFQEPGEKIATKCIRVSSSATTRAVIAALIEKFHPDMKMLSQPSYSIWEVHENGEERRLEPEERPLIVQLTWHKDDLEGRFVLKKEEPVLPNARPFNESSTENLRRSQQKRFSKREKKDLRKKYQQEQDNGQSEVYGTGTSAMSVYSELPQNTFTRTISNPEIVMKKRREKKLENKLKEMGHGGSLKIYGVELFPNRPYISLLVSVNDTAAKVLRDTLDKYGLEKENTQDYVLVEVTLSQAESALSRSLSDLKSVGQNQERCLADYERPLMDLLNRRDSANIVFLLRRRSTQIPPILPYSQSVYATRPTLPVDEEVDMYSNFQGSLRPSNSLSAIENTQSQRQNPNPMGHMSTSHTAINTPSGLTPPKPRHTMAVDPCLVPVNVAQHKNPQASQMISIQPGLSELGSEAAIQIRSNDQSVLPRHCAFMFRDGTVRVAPLHRSALVEVNGQPISMAVELKEGCYVRIGSQFIYRFHSSQDQFRRSNSLHQSHIGSSQQQLNQAGVSNATKFPDSLPLSQSYTAGVHDYPYEPTPVAQQAPLATHFDAVDDKISIVQQPSPSGSRKMVQSQFSRETPLPLVLEIVDQLAENDLLRYEIFGVHTGRFGFRLTPAFVLYMVSRHRLSPQFLPGVPGEDKIQIQRAFLNKFVDLCVDAVHVNSSNRETLVFWLANISELLHMLKTDHELNRLTSMHGDGIQDRFMDLVQKTFELFVDACRVELRTALHSFLGAATSNEHSVCDLLEDIVRQIRKFLLNSALTIQVFSQLFHFINMYIFNWLVTTQDGRSNMTRGFGLRLRHRLQLVLQWAERQGLEQACECHMDRINQTVNLLITPKSNDQIASLGATCYKLNSLQVRYLLESYITEEYEPRVSAELVDHVVYLASTQADMMAQQDGESVQLEESQHLMLPFLFPQDGYIVETLRGVPGELASYVTALQAKGLCRVIAQNDSNGFWTGYMSAEDSMTPSHNKSASLMSSSSIGTASSRTGGEAPPKMARQYHLIDGFGDANYALMNKSKSLNNGFGTEREQAQSVENGTQRRRPEIIRVVIRRAPNEGIGLSIVAAQDYAWVINQSVPAHYFGYTGKITARSDFFDPWFLVSVSAHYFGYNGNKKPAPHIFKTQLQDTCKMPITVTTRSRDRGPTRRPYSLYDMPIPNPNMHFPSNYNTKFPRTQPRPPSYIEFMASRLASMVHPVTNDPKISPDLESRNAFSSGGYLSGNGQYSSLDTRNTILDSGEQNPDSGEQNLDSGEQNPDSGDQCPTNCQVNSRNDKEPSRLSGFGDRRDSKGSSSGGASTSEVSSSSEGSCDLAKIEREAHPPELSECASSSSSFLYGKEETAQVKEEEGQVKEEAAQVLDLEKLQEDLGNGAKEKGRGDSSCWLSTLLQHYKSMLIWSSKKGIKSPAKIQAPDTAPGEPNPGIYVKKVIEGTPAHKDGRLHTGDQLLSVNSKSLVGITQEEAAQQMVSAGSEIHFEVAKQMAMINGLDTWLAKSMNEQNANPNLQMSKGQKSSQHPNGLSVSDFGGQKVHGRSISASELYSQADTASLTSAGSAQPAPNVPPHQYAQPHPYQSQGRLPSHYKPTQRSAACVVQPGRPAASPINARRNGNASPTPLLTTTMGNGQQVTSCGNMPQRFRPAQQQRSASTVPFGSHYANPNHRMSFESAAELANLQRQRASASLLTDYSNLPLISQISNNIGNNGMGPQAIQAPLAGMETESLNSSGSGNSGGVPTQNSGLSDQAPTHLIGEGTPTSSNSSSARSSGSQKYTKQQPLSLDLRLYQTKFNDQSSILNGNNGVHPGSGIQNPGQVLPAYSNSSTSTSPLPPPPAVSTYFNGGSDWSRQGVKPLDTENGQFRNNTHRNGAGGSQRQRIFTPASTSQLPIGQVRVFQQPAPGSQQPKQFPISGRRSAPLFGQEDPLRQVEQQASRAMTTDELNEELDRLDSKEVVTEADKQHYRKLLQELSERNGQESLGASKSSSDFRRVGMKSSRQTVSTSALDPDPNRPPQPTQPSMMMGRSNNGVALPYIGEMEFKLNRRAAQNPDFSSAPLKGHHLQQNSAENEIDDVSRVANRLNNMPIDEEAEENVETAQSNVIKSTLIYGQTAPKAPVEKAPVSAMRDSSSPEDKAKKRVQFRDLDNLETDENVDSSRNGHHHIRLPSMEEVEESLDKDHSKNGNIGDESEQEPRVQIIGTNEVYKDPRQRRLDQQHQAKALRPVVDGSNLGFRDKMKLFATQLGEQTPKNKLKNSSVERDIELQINNGNNPGS